MPGDRTRGGSTCRSALILSLALPLVAPLVGCTASRGFQFQGTTAASFLRTIEQSNDPNARYAAYDKLSSPRCFDNDEQKARAAQVLAEKLQKGKEPVATRAVICRTLGMLRRPEAREVILTATDDANEDPLVRAEACRALGRVGRVEDATILTRIMTAATTEECQIAAIESLGDLKSPERRINEYLVLNMENDKPAIRVACLKALRSITGKDLGVEATDWKQYVESLPPDPGSATEAPPTEPRRVADLPGNRNPAIP